MKDLDFTPDPELSARIRDNLPRKQTMTDEMDRARQVAHPERPYCTTCHSHDVRRDASVAWNEEAQGWEIVSVYDNADCEVCGGECDLAWEPLT